MKEFNVWRVNGFLGILGTIVLLGLGAYVLLFEMIVPGVLLVLAAIILLTGVTVIQPNQAAVVSFFGKYVGTVRDAGIFLTIPFSFRKKVSLRVRNFNSKKLKVNDVDGNPIEIAAVVVFKVIDSAKAVFDVDHYEEFVEIQSETALRHVATKYPYDTYEDETTLTLRGNAEVVADELTKELQARLILVGVEIIEARLTHLAYSTEIASAMLQRQQASAILAARKKIVEGAVSMAQMAIKDLEAGDIRLDEERKAQMINNLMVAIVSDRSAQPVINTGTIY